MSARAIVIQEAIKVATEQGVTLTHITDDLALADSGLSSLSFAVLVVRLEERLGISPFNDSEEFEFPLTFGDFVRLYEHAEAAIAA